MTRKSAAYRYAATCHRVVDGDTFELALDLGFKATLIVPVRLRGVDTPEMDTAAGRRAYAFVNGLLGDAALIVETSKRPHGADVQTFARYVADVWLTDGRRLADVLVDAGHARVIAP